MLSPSASRAEPLLRPDCQGIPVWGPEVSSESTHTNTFASGQSSRGPDEARAQLYNCYLSWRFSCCCWPTSADTAEKLGQNTKGDYGSRFFPCPPTVLYSAVLIMMGVKRFELIKAAASINTADTSAVKTLSLCFRSSLPLPHSFSMLILCCSVTLQALFSAVSSILPWLSVPAANLFCLLKNWKACWDPGWPLAPRLLQLLVWVIWSVVI